MIWYNSCLRSEIFGILGVVIISLTLGIETRSYFYERSAKIEATKPVPPKPLTTLEKIKQRGTLDVVILNAPTTYYEGAQGATGFEYDLIKAYSDSINVELNLTVVKTVHEALTLSEKNIGDITSASLSFTKLRDEKYFYGPRYFRVYEQMVCHRDTLRKRRFPKKIEGLKGLSIVVGAHTSNAETLEEMKKDYPDLNYSLSSDFSTDELLEKVWKKEIDCTVSDSNIFAINLRYYPELLTAFVVKREDSLAWLLREKSDDFRLDLYKWLNVYTQTGKMEELKDRHYSYIDMFSYYSTKMFHERIKYRLPKYKKLFVGAGKKYDIPWTLIAAQSYQESHWDQHAVSNTGVKGLMMLTRDTAKLLKIKDRKVPWQSVYGGTRYLRQIEKLLPEGVKEEDRLQFILAAYNVGMGHIYDAQKLAIKLHKNPNLWSDIRTVLPLLSQKKYYRYLKYGYARGNEPVLYVDAISNYRNILENHLKRLAEEKLELEKELLEDQNLTSEINASSIPINP